MVERRTVAAAPRRQLSRRRKLLFALVPVTLLAIVGEVCARQFRHSRSYPKVGGNSYRDQRIDLIRRAFPAAHDPVLGFVPQAGYAGADNIWHTQVTIDAGGLRSNGPNALPVADAPAVLAVGDSFTFGDQVSDGDTWPAQLEQLLRRPVRNGGVFGYGFDQTVLRAEQLLERMAIDVVICSLIPDDLKRCELSHRYTPKPWFAFVGDGIELRGVPVPDTSADNALDRQWLRRLMGHSALLDTVFWNAAPSWWVGQPREVAQHPPGTGLALGRALVDRLAQRCAAKHARLLLVLQGQAPEMAAGEPVRAPELLAHAQARGVATLDLATKFRAMADVDPTLDARYFAGHMTAAGNRWVAEQLAAQLAATAGTRPR